MLAPAPYHVGTHVANGPVPVGTPTHAVPLKTSSASTSSRNDKAPAGGVTHCDARSAAFTNGTTVLSRTVFPHADSMGVSATTSGWRPISVTPLPTVPKVGFPSGHVEDRGGAERR